MWGPTKRPSFQSRHWPGASAETRASLPVTSQTRELSSSFSAHTATAAMALPLEGRGPGSGGPTNGEGSALSTPPAMSVITSINDLSGRMEAATTMRLSPIATGPTVPSEEGNERASTASGSDRPWANAASRVWTQSEASTLAVPWRSTRVFDCRRTPKQATAIIATGGEISVRANARLALGLPIRHHHSATASMSRPSRIPMIPRGSST